MARKSIGSNPETVLRDARVLELRIAGKTFAAIAKEVGFSNESGAYHSLQRAMQRTMQEPADELRKVERERLDRLFDVAFAKATASEGRNALLAIDRCLAIQARRAALDGLDAPFRIEERVISEDAVDAEIRRLSQQLAENDPDAVDVVGP